MEKALSRVSLVSFLSSSFLWRGIIISQKLYKEKREKYMKNYAEKEGY
jgi:hypothetical protein